VAPTGSQNLNGGCSDMNLSSKAHGDLIKLAIICREAARCHGDNWHAVEQYIKKSVDALPKDQRNRLVAEIGRVLRYYAPAAGARTQ
jgi:hypothetical protein